MECNRNEEEGEILNVFSFSKRNMQNNAILKFKGRKYYRVISVLTEADLKDEIKCLKRTMLKKGIKNPRYKVLEKELGVINPIVAYHLYCNKLESAYLNR